MSYFKAKMHQIHFGWSSAPDPAARAYSALPDLLSGFKGAYFQREEGKGREVTGDEGR